MAVHAVYSAILTIILLLGLPPQNLPEIPTRSDSRVCCASMESHVWRERSDVDNWSSDSDEIRPIQRADRISMDELAVADLLRRSCSHYEPPSIDNDDPSTSHVPRFPGHLFFCVILS